MNTILAVSAYDMALYNQAIKQAQTIYRRERKTNEVEAYKKFQATCKSAQERLSQASK